jgi:hypothetical protein
MYLIFHQILLTATNGKTWIYTALKFSLKINQGWTAAGTVFGMLVLACASFCCMQFALWFKCRFLRGLNLPGGPTYVEKTDSTGKHLELQEIKV